MISFKDFISEANYGALQTDKRIATVRDKLIKKLVNAWARERKTEVTVDAVVDYHLDSFDHEDDVVLNILMEEPPEEAPRSLIFFGGVAARRFRHQNVIVISIRNDVSYKEAIDNVDAIKPLLSHEIKHIVDNIDNRFGENNMASYIKHDGTNYKQYVTQVQEINNFLITVIEDLELVRKKNPDISFADALAQSWWWNHLQDRALFDYNKINKFKSKLAQYWTHEKVITGRIDHAKELRLQLMLLLYQWHKDGDIKKMKEMGMSTVNTLMKNIERMDLQQLRDQVAKFQNLLAERGK